MTLTSVMVATVYIAEVERSISHISCECVYVLRTTNMTTQEIPQWLIDEQRRKAVKRLENKIRRTLVATFFTLFFGLLTLCIFLAGYAGYKYLEERSVIRYVREEVETPHVIVSATITAYTSSIDETDNDPFITASGSTVKRGTLACPSKYKFGTVVIIEGNKYTCEDRMNKRYRHTERFDIWVESKSEAYDWGKRELQIKVLY